MKCIEMNLLSPGEGRVMWQMLSNVLEGGCDLPLRSNNWGRQLPKNDIFVLYNVDMVPKMMNLSDTFLPCKTSDLLLLCVICLWTL